ncbi:NAD(P)/FAD-dependent oxidoreductase [Maribellus comscasis]|uniref:NAD(P)/FAD-dependent oxidoreductase n=1 Tax=Maribellus comscasis TaxID=2681766 RepID=A0A6I6JWW7_9BACT|nr:FAD/NAD(P)-binding oxidoreductase [Maribellus comscasis]QGY42254.1 NAD(P)/FAD-dependent oxidoreductase [Maribellus comscasis]
MKIVVLGAGISGHTAAAFLKKKLGKKHDVIVVSPSQYYQWIPSNIWVGVGRMTVDQVRFKLEKVYKRWGIVFKQAKANAIHPEGDEYTNMGFVDIEYTTAGKKGQTEKVEYDFLVNATGPKLNFEATEGLGPGKNTVSVCSYDHAEHAWEELEKSIKRMKEGKKQRFLIGTGHPMATCQGAAFEYALNIAFELKRRKLSHMAEITWISNEYEVGDFGMGGAFIKRGGYITSTKVFTESVFAENNIKWIKRAGVKRVEPGAAHYETLNGEEKTAEFDFAMLIPGFAGQGLKAYNKNGEDITSTLFAANGFMKVDADYTPKPFEEWSINDWPQTYQNPTYSNIYAAGIAFAPPHSISKPMKSVNGTPIFPAPPRTGMPSGVIGKIIAQNIAHAVKTGKTEHKHTASMGRMGAACIVSAGYSLTNGLGATMTVSPVVPDWEKYPDWGRNIKSTVGEIGLAGHWIKLFLHYMFLHKAKGYPLWWLLPE